MVKLSLKHSHVAATLFFAVILCPPADIATRQQRNLTDESFERARGILDRGTEAAGGLKTFQAIEDIDLEFSAVISEIGQSKAPDSSYFMRPLNGESIIDIRGKRNYTLNRTNFLGSRLHYDNGNDGQIRIHRRSSFQSDHRNADR